MINNNLTPLALRFLKKERIYAKSIFYSSDYISNLFKSYKINEDSFYISFHLIYYIIDNKKNNMDIIYFYNQKFIKFINRELAIKLLYNVMMYCDYLLLNDCKSIIYLNRDKIIPLIMDYVNRISYVNYNNYIYHCVKIINNAANININIINFILYIERNDSK